MTRHRLTFLASSPQPIKGSFRTMKRINTRVSVSVLLLGALTLQGLPAAHASEAYADQVIDDVRVSTPVGTPGATETPLTIVPDEGEYTGVSTEMEFAIPNSTGEDLVLDSPGDAPLTVALPDVQVSGAVLNTASNAVVYPENGDDVAVAVQAFDEGAQLSTVLNSAESPEAFQYTVSVPAGAELTLLEDGGVAITDAEGFPIGFMSSPWAKDRMGATVPTRYSVSGNTVTQFVDHRGMGFQYPIVADPYLWKDLIKSAKWDWIRRSPGGAIGAGWTLRVKPTLWARLNGASYYIGWLGWKELYRKYRNRGLCCNLDSMKDQWICHHQFVAIRRPFADTWNLDEWRKDVSYPSTVRYQCNPPRGGKYAYN